MTENYEQNKKQLTLGSLFSGSGGFELAGVLAGIKPVWKSEVEPFAVCVTEKRFPDVKHYGDINELNGKELPPVDIITGGFPCQDVSIAGKRAGLVGKRTGLFYEAIRIIKEMREATNGKYPRFFVAENVTGLYSSNKGEDFRTVLEEIIKIAEPQAPPVPMPGKEGWPYADVYLGDGWSVAYRTLDAQYFGTAQRRRRMFLVADFRDRSAGEILFKSESLSRYTPQGFRTWQGAAGDFTQGTGTAGGGRRGEIVLNDQGGQRMDVTEDVTCTLRAEAHHPPCVIDGAAGFCTEHSANARSIGYEEERSPTLRAGVVPAVVPLDNHPQDCRIKIEEDGKVQTLSNRMGTGGNNVPLLMEEQVPQALRMRQGKSGGGKGPLIQGNLSGTLGCSNDQTVFVPEPKSCYWDGSQTAGTLTHRNASGSQRMPDKENFNCVLEKSQKQKAYGISAFKSNAMLSDNPHSGIYEAETSRTLDCNGGSPVNQQGGIAIVEEESVAFAQNQRNEVRDLGDKTGALQAEPGMKQQTYVLQGNMIGRSDKNGPQGCGISEEVCYTLTDVDRHAVAAPDPVPNDNENKPDPSYGIDRAAFNQGKNAKFGFSIEEELSPTLVSKGPNAVSKTDPVSKTETHYTVRRLTPTECARLQGFPSTWCSDLGNPNPTDEEVKFWMDVWETHRKVVSHASKPKTEKQVRKWLANPYSDSAVYRLYGNGVALPCVYFVMCGIAWAAETGL